ncbi:MAG: hypothetical protein JST00_02785 [Deltaproteobacteria bacterium]|nr:hypothetical protein [Deltaproteobacteria bacterium]
MPRTWARVAALLGAAATFLAGSHAEAKPQKKVRTHDAALAAAKPKKKAPKPVARDLIELDETKPPAPKPPSTSAADSSEPKTEPTIDPKEPTTVTPSTDTTSSRTAPTPVGAGEPDVEGEAAEKKLEFSGRLFTHFRSSFDIDEPLQQVSTSVWLDAHARMTKATFASISGAGDLLTPNVDGKVEARARLREGYAGAHGGGFELRIGQQILSWGNSDVVHAVDFLTAQDYTFYSANADARQIGAPSVVLSYSPDDGASPFKVTAVWQPAFPSTKVFVPKGKIPAAVTVLEEERPKLSLLNSEAALKIGVAPGGWDIALIGFHGWNHVAEPYVGKIDVQAGTVEVGRRFHRYEAIGLQASVALDSWVLRFEGAYVATENPNGRNRFVQPSHIDAIAGIERPFGERVRASVQGIVKVHPRWLSLDAPHTGAGPEEIALKQALVRLNAQVLNYTHQIRPGASLAISYASEDESFEMGIAGIAYFTGFDWAVQPSIGYRLGGALKLDVGAQIFGGKQNSLGFMSKQSGMFAQATYTF